MLILYLLSLLITLETVQLIRYLNTESFGWECGLVVHVLL